MDRIKLSLGTWASIIALTGAVGGVCTAVATEVFASKDAVHAIELKQTADQGAATLSAWRIKTVETKLDNIQVQQTRIDTNVEKLLDRFRVSAEPRPSYKALPDPPHPGTVPGRSLPPGD